MPEAFFFAARLPDSARIVAGSQVVNSLTGTWIANIEKSRRHANHQFQSATLSIEVSGNRVSLTHSGVNMSGKHESGQTVLHADGEEHAVSPQAPDIVVITRWNGLHALETEARKDGRVVGRGTYAVSDDGGTLTALVSGTDAGGTAFEQEIVFERG